jgi:hypothetical protein
MKKIVLTIGLAAISAIGFGQITFIQNYMNGMEVGDYKYTCTDSTITYEAIGKKSIETSMKMGLPITSTQNAKLVSTKKVGEGSIVYTYNASYVDFLGFDVRQSITIVYNPNPVILFGEQVGSWSTTTKQFSTFDNSSTETFTMYMKL